MSLRLENLAKWVSLIALIVLISALTFNIKIGENKMGVTPQEFVNQMQPYANGNTTAAAKFVADMVPYATGNSMEPGTVNNPAPKTTTRTSTVSYDPYAAQRAAEAQAKAQADQRARDSFNAGTNAYRDSVNSRATNEGLNYKNSVIDWATGVSNQQSGIDNKAVNAEMAKSQGYKGIMSMVGQGIKSGGVMLANKNAGNSSGAEAIANAYSQLGQRQAAGVNNQYGQAQNQIGLEQSQLEASKAAQLGKFRDYKVQISNSIVDDARSKIGALNEAAANASIADRLDIAAEIENVKNTANAQLQQYDAELGRAKGASSADARRAEAQRLANLGTAPDQAFNYSTEAPAQFQNSGPWASELPLWTYNSRNKYQG